MLLPNMKTGLLLALIQLHSVWTAPPSTESWVTVSSDSPSSKQHLNDDTPKVPKISSMRVDTNVTNRFATSLVTSRVKNMDSKPQEALFSVVLPDTAYITGFTMEIDGKKYDAYIQEKEMAKKTYDQAVSSGNAAGHVAVNARDSNKFTVSVNIMPESKATFYLKYEELLSRQKGLYDIVINLHPGQPVTDMLVQVYINETRSLTSVSTPSLRSGNEISKNNDKIDPKAEIEYIGKNAAKITFKPDVTKQKEFAKELGTDEDNGFAGQFIVEYDVERDPEGGELLFADGYFVHFFAPKDAKPEPKQITFVLDTSGSMWGTRIRQLKEAMKGILDQLNGDDSFNIIDFNSVVNVWNISTGSVQYQEGELYSFYENQNSQKSREGQVLPESFEISGKSIEKAKQVVEELRPSGATNIESALQIALKLHKNNKNDDRQPLIMFLTDGQATEGITSSDGILSKISENNVDSIPIISISFGDGADKKLLEKLSLRNHGFARHIYEGADADLQLKSFYEIISSPLFNKIKFTYASENVTELTKTEFPILFRGSELVVAGKYRTPALDPGFAPGVSPLFVDLPVIRCFSGSTAKEFKPTAAKPIGGLEKHWAYLTLKQILKEREAADKKEELTKKALDLALKYSFVTEVSSLVVVKPNATNSATDLQDASKGSSPAFNSFSAQRLPARPAYGGGFPGSAPIGLSGFSGYSDRSFIRRRPMGPQFYPTTYFPFRGTSYTLPLATHPPMLTTETMENLRTDDNATIEKLKKELSWFAGIYNLANETISLPQGKFLIGNEEQITKPYSDCPNTPINGTGHCVPLGNCPQMFPHLQTIPSYIHSFCSVGKFAGVCCPINLEQPIP